MFAIHCLFHFTHSVFVCTCRKYSTQKSSKFSFYRWTVPSNFTLFIRISIEIVSNFSKNISFCCSAIISRSSLQKIKICTTSSLTPLHIISNGRQLATKKQKKIITKKKFFRSHFWHMMYEICLFRVAWEYRR